MSELSSTAELIALLRKGTGHLVNMAKALQFPWDPTIKDPRKLHNMYARNLVTAYVSKVADLSNGVLLAIEHENFLMYAVCGRALIETTAMLRYYVLEKYKPLLERKQGTGLSRDDMRRLIELDDQHLRGGKFDWESFLFQRYSKLKDDARVRMESKGKRARPVDGSSQPEQIRIGHCIESWGRETPAILVVYNLFCDLVHPNIGSTFLVASSSGKELYFSRFRGEPVGRAILEQSLPMLLSVGHKEFDRYLDVLIATIWHDDEVSE